MIEENNDEEFLPVDKHAFGEVDEEILPIPPASEIPVDPAQDQEDNERDDTATYKRPRAHSTEEDTSVDHGFSSFYNNNSNGSNVKTSVTLPGSRPEPRITRPRGRDDSNENQNNGGTVGKKQLKIQKGKRKSQRHEHGSPIRIEINNNQPRFHTDYNGQQDFNSLSSAVDTDQRRILKIVKRDERATTTDVRPKNTKSITLKSGKSITSAAVQPSLTTPNKHTVPKADVNIDTLNYTPHQPNPTPTKSPATALPSRKSLTTRKQADYNDVFVEAPVIGKGFGLTAR